MPSQFLKASPDRLPEIEDVILRTKAVMEQEQPDRKWGLSSEAWAEEASRIRLKDADYEWEEGSEYPSGISKQSWERFRKGKSILAENFKCYCKVLQLDWEKIVDKNSSGLTNNRQDSLEFTNNSKFRSLIIADKTQDFVGREYIFGTGIV